MRYFVTLAYDGTNFHGWQIQPNSNSIQEEMERTLGILLQQEIKIVAAGRTDTGVHAKKMIAHFDIENQIENTNDLLLRWNSLLPRDIAVFQLQLVDETAHARFSALSRKYEYHVSCIKDPFLENYSARFGSLDFEKMNKVAKRLFDYTDFSSFCKVHTDALTRDCNIMQAHWERRGDVWVFTIEANRFLRNMVRAIVGTLVAVGRGRLSEEEFCRIIEAKDRCAAGGSAPAKGLFLVDVTYPKEVFEYLHKKNF